MTLVTDVFEVRAKQYLQAQGYGHIPVVVTANPVVYLAGDALDERARGLVPAIVNGLTSAARPAAAG